MSNYNMNMKEAIQKFIDAFVKDGGNVNSKVSMGNYYVGITNDLDRRSKEHNATFIAVVTAKSKDAAVELEDKLGELGFDDGDRPGNGTDADSVNVIYLQKDQAHLRNM